MLSKGFHFVTETGTHRPDGPVRNLIRSQARRSGQAKGTRRIETDKHAHVTIRTKKKSTRNRMSSHPHEDHTHEDENEVVGRELAYPRISPEPGRNPVVDPFGVSGTGHSDSVLNLLNHCKYFLRGVYYFNAALRPTTMRFLRVDQEVTVQNCFTSFPNHDLS
jgi:hypothetical protein